VQSSDDNLSPPKTLSKIGCISFSITDPWFFTLILPNYCLPMIAALAAAGPGPFFAALRLCGDHFPKSQRANPNS